MGFSGGGHVVVTSGEKFGVGVVEMVAGAEYRRGGDDGAMFEGKDLFTSFGFLISYLSFETTWLSVLG